MINVARRPAKAGAARGVVRGRWWAILTWRIAAVVAGGAVIWGGAAVGAWYVPVLLGACCGAWFKWVSGGTVPASVIASLAAVGGWLAPFLVKVAQGQPVVATARVVAALAGLPADAAVVICLMLVVALLQAMAGVWVGWALVALARPPR